MFLHFDGSCTSFDHKETVYKCFFFPCNGEEHFKNDRIKISQSILLLSKTSMMDINVFCHGNVVLPYIVVVLRIRR